MTECYHGWGESTVDKQTNRCVVCGKMPLYWSLVNPDKWHTADGWEYNNGPVAPGPQNRDELVARYVEIVIEELRWGNIKDGALLRQLDRAVDQAGAVGPLPGANR